MMMLEPFIAILKHKSVSQLNSDTNLKQNEHGVA